MKKSRRERRNLEGITVLQIVTGSIAAYKSGDIIQTLRKEGARVLCVLTESAKKFVTPLTLRAISGQNVYDDFFTTTSPYDVIHTSLAEEADIILVAPASANFIARLAAGLADDLASCIVLAAQSPVVIAPAMNDRMFTHPLTQANIRKLKDIGYSFLEPIEGHLICGKEAIGHIVEDTTIVQELARILQGKKVRPRFSPSFPDVKHK